MPSPHPGIFSARNCPKQLPDELFGLINNHILHKINDVQTISRLQQVITGMDEAT